MTDRFWQKVDKTDECWLWTAATNTTGYGVFWVDGALVVAHRFSYESMVGQVPEGMQLDHLCRNRSCVNPAHLEPVTQQENIRRGEAGLVSGRQQSSKTHCPAGHEFTAANTYINPGAQSRACRACRRERQSKRRLIKAS